MTLDGIEEIAHLSLFVDDIVREEQAVRRQAREDEIEEPFVIDLPRIQKYKIERAGHLRNFLERISRDDGDDVGKPGAADVGGSRCRARRVELDRRQMAAVLPEGEADPDGTVAVGGANLERVLRVARGGEHAQKASVFLRDGKLAGVSRFDLGEQLENVSRYLRLRNGCGDRRGKQNGDDDEPCGG